MREVKTLNTGDAIYVCSIAALYSTGHWLGATAVLVLFCAVKLDLVR